MNLDEIYYRTHATYEIPEGTQYPFELPEGKLIRATVSFKDNPNKTKKQTDFDVKVDCCLVKHKNADQYTIYPYITHTAQPYNLRYKRIICIWDYEVLP